LLTSSREGIAHSAQATWKSSRSRVCTHTHTDKRGEFITDQTTSSLRRIDNEVCRRDNLKAGSEENPRREDSEHTVFRFPPPRYPPELRQRLTIYIISTINIRCVYHTWKFACARAVSSAHTCVAHRQVYSRVFMHQCIYISSSFVSMATSGRPIAAPLCSGSPRPPQVQPQAQRTRCIPSKSLLLDEERCG
jgi:hypothetical protein